MENTTASLFLDTRRANKDNKYPVKLSIYNSSQQKKKLYATIFYFTKDEFNNTWTVKPRKEFKTNNKKMAALLNYASSIIDKITPFTFEAFEDKFFKKRNTNYSDVLTIFDEVEKQNIERGSISNAEKYRFAKKCIEDYLKYKGKKTDYLDINTINIPFLENFTFYCENVRKLAPATIGIYTRNLRAIYRIAIKNGAINEENYPFGKDKYKIPVSGKVNKALTEEQIKKLWKTEPENEYQSFAKDFWFFSYFAYGMNTRDICELKHTDVESNNFTYERAKTRTTKKERKVKQVPITPSMRNIIEKRKNTDSPYLFGILTGKETPTQAREKIHGFTKKINKHFRTFAKHAEIEEELADQLGTYHARHSFATIAIRKGKSIALISEILHDGNLKVTENYINSFHKEDFDELSKDMEL